MRSGPRRRSIQYTAFQKGGAVFVAIVSAVISSHTAASGAGEARGILDAMRPANAILIPTAMAGTIVPLTVRRPRSNIQGVEALLPGFEAN
jgi:Na+/proline symporter